MRFLSDFMKPERVEKGLSVILRLPGLFILDYYYYYHQSNISNNDSSITDSQDITAILKPFMPYQAILFLLLPLELLVTLYMHILSAALLGYAELYSQHYVTKEQNKDAHSSLLASNMTEPKFGQIQHHIKAISLHIFIATMIAFLLNIECNAKRVVLAVYTVPVSARLANFPIEYLGVLHKFATAVTVLAIVFYCLMSLPRLLLYLRLAYRRAVQNDLLRGPLVLQDILCEKFYIMPQFLVFWCLLLGVQLCKYWYPQLPRPGSTTVYPAEQSEWYLLLLYAMADICASPVSLTASCIAVVYISWAVLSLTTLLAKGPVVDMRAGTGEGVTMALLALQTGLVDLPMPQRLGAMSVILFIVLGSLVQSMHEVVEPMLLTLCASHTHSLAKHARVLALCLFLLIFPLYMTVFLCRLFEVDFWTLVVVSTCALTSVQVLGALTVYALFMYDALQKESGWDALDDVVYAARAVTRVLEFVVAVLVVGAGVHESMLVSSEGRPWSWLNGSVLAIHFYYNVYQRLQSGWKSFLLRREAARRIHSLPCATEEQLRLRAHDVCAICYMEMSAACVTPCTHLFHSTCLKKWLYVQDRCPLCSAQIVFAKDVDVIQTLDVQPTSTVKSESEKVTETEHFFDSLQTLSSSNVCDIDPSTPPSQSNNHNYEMANGSSENTDTLCGSTSSNVCSPQVAQLSSSIIQSDGNISTSTDNSSKNAATCDSKASHIFIPQLVDSSTSVFQPNCNISTKTDFANSQISSGCVDSHTVNTGLIDLSTLAIQSHDNSSAGTEDNSSSKNSEASADDNTSALDQSSKNSCSSNDLVEQFAKTDSPSKCFPLLNNLADDHNPKNILPSYDTCTSLSVHPDINPMKNIHLSSKTCSTPLSNLAKDGFTKPDQFAEIPSISLNHLISSSLAKNEICCDTSTLSEHSVDNRLAE